jgi:hypothetical protein
MHAANFCVECGEPLSRKGWRAWLGGKLCARCSERLGSLAAARPVVVIMVVAIAAFMIGQHMRPSPPPLIIQRAANYPLSDAPVNFNAQTEQPRVANLNSNLPVTTADDTVYICGARTKKGTPCHRRVHTAGERCFQHKGMTAMLPPEKLVIRSKQ